ncbi:MAG: bifunctional ornithine acetyltransferase/N-acetylglutamate synthase [Fusobacteriaceae bacterium]
MKIIIDGNITSAKGFYSAGEHIGIKKFKKDLSLIYSEVEAEVAGVFTKNLVKAAPVVYCQKINSGGQKVKGIIVNSGNANACTGEQGYKDAEEMAEIFGKLLNTTPDKILVGSTGVIGVNLPMEKLRAGIPKVFNLLGTTYTHGEMALEGIMTTDTTRKKIAVEFELDGKIITVGGIAKGSGMIHPNMGTMLSYITTDANISKELLQKAMDISVVDTYNMISVDGDTSTNDCSLILANGLAGNDKISAEDKNFEKFCTALSYVNRFLAIEIVKDGEGATKLMEVHVSGAKDKATARLISKSVISSSLFKAALFGADANWGRVLCAMGYSGGEFDTSKVNIKFKSLVGEIELMKNSNPLKFSEELAKEILSEREITVNIELADGDGVSTAWGCDLTYDYVKINGDYRS